MKTKFYFTLIFLTAATVMISCKGKQEAEEQEETAVKTTDSIPAVNVYDYSTYGLPVLEDYYDSKSRLTFLRVGESVISLGIRETDTINKKDYSKIRLSDGTVGWARSDYIIENAVAGAIIEPTPVYERPDILTKSSRKEFNGIDVVAVVGEKDDWYNVTGRNNFNQGWIMKEYVSVSKEDVAMTILARKELYDSKGNIMDDKLNDFINNAPYPGSRIVTILRDRLIKSVEMKAMSHPIETQDHVESLPE